MLWQGIHRLIDPRITKDQDHVGRFRACPVKLVDQILALCPYTQDAMRIMQRNVVDVFQVRQVDQFAIG